MESQDTVRFHLTTASHEVLLNFLAQNASSHLAESAPKGKKRGWDGDSSEPSNTKRPCSEPARKFKTPTFKIPSEQDIQLKMFQEKPKRIVTWLGQLEPESYERMGSPTIEDCLKSSPSRSPAPSLHLQDVMEKTDGPPENTQQKLEQPSGMPHPSPDSESTKSRRVEDPSAERKDAGSATCKSSYAEARHNELGRTKSPEPPAGK